jgi:histidine triad (HIT) family protein
MNSAECIFCKIVAGEIPAAVIYENDAIISFLDIGPLNEGHTLIIPKSHVETVDACDPGVLAGIGKVLGPIAKAVVAATQCEGFNCLCNNGKVAGQVVNHLHFHIIPRYKDDGIMRNWPAKQYGQGGLEAMLEKIKKNL